MIHTILRNSSLLSLLLLSLGCQGKELETSKLSTSNKVIIKLEELPVNYRPIDYLGNNKFFILNTSSLAERIVVRENNDFNSSTERYSLDEEGRILSKTIEDDEGIFKNTFSYDENGRLLKNDLYFNEVLQDDSFHYDYTIEHENGEIKILCKIISMQNPDLNRDFIEKIYHESGKIILFLNCDSPSERKLSLKYNDGVLASYTYSQPVIEDYSVKLLYSDGKIEEVEMYNKMNEKENVISFEYDSSGNLKKRTLNKFDQQIQVDEYEHKFNEKGDWVNLRIISTKNNQKNETYLEREIQYR